MGQTRPPEAQPTEEEIPPEAWLIGGLLAGSIPVPPGLTLPTAIAVVLLSAIPENLLTRSLEAAHSAQGIASLLIADAGAGRSLQEYGMKAMYGINALLRVAKAEDKVKALEKERGFYEQHREASDRREKGLRQAQAMAEIHDSDILSWNHTGTAKTHRPAHVAASGFNFDWRNPPKATGGALPGQLPGCDCMSGAPRPGAKVLR
jgi:hypothetical protein